MWSKDHVSYMTRNSYASEAARSIANEVAGFRRSESSLPVTRDHATAKLLAKSLDAEEIDQRRDAFVTSSEIDATAVLANYELLHGIKYIDSLEDGFDRSVDARAITSIFRGSEICFHNLTTLAHRLARDVSLGHWGEAAVKMTWATHFTETLHRLSQLLVRMDHGAADGDALCVAHSPAFAGYCNALSGMHEALRNSQRESASDLATKDLDDPRRFVFFHGFVNTNYDAMLRSIFDSVRLPGVFRKPEEDGRLFYERVVQCSLVRDAVTSVDLRDETYLMQFRAYHQISEILVGMINSVGCDVILALIDDSVKSLASATRALICCNSLLQLVTDNIRPIVRTLSPKAYLAIRPALGITSGSHSHNLRKGLFLTVYPLLVRAFRLRLNAFDEADAGDDGKTLERARNVLQRADDGGYGPFMRNLVYVYQSVRTWRDEHIQFVKTQIGVSHEAPTASISGSENAAETAHGFRKAHVQDPIGPVYEAVLGRRPPAPLPLVHADEFDDYMARLTADAVQSMYSDVQTRVHRKRAGRQGPQP